MFNGDTKEWMEIGDLESYSFEDFHQNDESHMPNQTQLIELNVDYVPFNNEPNLFDSKMETYQSECSFREPEDNHFFHESECLFVQEHKLQIKPPNPPPQDDTPEDKPKSRQKAKKEKKIRKTTNPKKNQYDKNIFANINAAILKKLATQEVKEELEIYCQYQRVQMKDFHSYFIGLEHQKIRLGTTQLSKFYESQEISEGWKKVFGMFCVRFLRHEYVRYILREGKMQNKDKYLRCATKMMYIPRLRKEEYRIISCLVNKVVDI